jgi:hypothetical protein
VRAVKLLVPVVVLAALALVEPPPVGATVNVSVSSSTMSVTIIGSDSVSFSCVGGNTRVNGQPTNPALACSALTRVGVTGSDGTQVVDGSGLDAAAFSAGAFLEVSLGGGADVVTDTRRADSIAMGAGTDRLTMKADGAVNTLVNLGDDDTDSVLIEGTPEADGFYVGALGPNATVRADTTSGSRFHTFQLIDALRIAAGDGHDGLSTVDVIPGATLTSLEMDGGDGDDDLLSGSVGTRMVGGDGTNTMRGGTGADVAVTGSRTDTIDLGLGDNDIVDGTSLRAGGRTVTVTAGGRDTYGVQHPAIDAVVRVRPAVGGGSVTSSLSRSGRQDVGASFAGAEAAFRSDINARHLVDVVLAAGTDGYRFDLDTFGDDLLDVTIPTGGWSSGGGPGSTMTIDPHAPGIGSVTATGVSLSTVSIHGAWATPNEGFAHRVVRDLMFRFLPPVERAALTARLGAGTSRATVVGELVDTDEYRGLDVDRIFAQYLRRTPDAAGRAYWIDSIDGGNPLWRVRAQVFGSPEYFTKAGGTNAAFVRKAYADVLGRLPDAAGQQYWVERLEAGVLRSVVAKQFLTVAETRNRIVDDQVLRFLDRPATPAERSTWAPRMNEVGGEQALIRFLAASTSYFQRT